MLDLCRDVLRTCLARLGEQEEEARHRLCPHCGKPYDAARNGSGPG
jgi:hypothetical protein